MNHTDKYIEIFNNKKKAFILLLVSLFFVVMGFFFVMYPDQFKRVQTSTPIFTRTVGVLTIAFFGFAVIISIQLFLKSKSALRITSQGIFLGSNHETFIAWDNIENFSEILIHSTPLIIIYVNNSEEVIEKEQNRIKKKLMRYNLHHFGSPYSISTSTLDISHIQLMELLRKYLK